MNSSKQIFNNERLTNKITKDKGFPIKDHIWGYTSEGDVLILV